MNETERRCINCDYFDHEQSKEGGYCRRFPPSSAVDGVCYFVGVGLDDWCGEFKERTWWDDRSERGHMLGV